MTLSDVFTEIKSREISRRQVLFYNGSVIQISSNYYSLGIFIEKCFDCWNMITDCQPLDESAIQVKALCDRKLTDQLVVKLSGLKQVEGYFFGVSCIKYYYQSWLIIYSYHRNILYIFNKESYDLYVIGHDEKVINLSVSSCANLFFSSQLLKNDFSIVHAAALSFSGQGFLIVGKKGAGKTSTILSLLGEGVKFLGNDRCYLKIVNNGLFCQTLQQDIPLGLGFINSIGWGQEIRDRILLGQMQHPGTKSYILNRIQANDFTPQYRESGREYKYYLFTSQIPNLIADIATNINVVLRPHVSAYQEIAVKPTSKNLIDSQELFFEPTDEIFLEIVSSNTIRS